VTGWILRALQAIENGGADWDRTGGQRLLYGMKLVEEQQILLGDGTGFNLHGIIPQACTYSPVTIISCASQAKSLPCSSYSSRPNLSCSKKNFRFPVGSFTIVRSSQYTPECWNIPIALIDKQKGELKAHVCANAFHEKQLLK